LTEYLVPIPRPTTVTIRADLICKKNVFNCYDQTG